MQKEINFLLASLFSLWIATFVACKEGSKTEVKSVLIQKTEISSTLRKDVVKPEVELTLLKLTDALKAKDLELYLKQIPEDFNFQEENGALLNRKQYHDKLSKEWSGLIETSSIEVAFVKFSLGKDFVNIRFSTRWERKVRNANGGADIIFSVYDTDEIWKPYKDLWLPQQIRFKEISKLVNGK
jgi:hypothetical protein